MTVIVVTGTPRVISQASVTVLFTRSLRPPDASSRTVGAVDPPGDVRVLVLSDHPLERYIFEYLLTDAGYAVTLAEGETDARRLAAATRPDVVIYDLHMNGDAWRRIEAVCPGVVLVVAGHFMSEVQARQMGAAAFVASQNYGGVVDAVRAVLGMAHAGPGDEVLPYQPPLADRELLVRAMERARDRMQQARLARELEGR